MGLDGGVPGSLHSAAHINRLRRRVREGAHSEPRGDRDPGRPDAEGDGDRVRRRLLRDRPRCAACARGRRGVPDRAGCARGELPQRRQDHRDGEGGRGGGDPSRLRLPRRERRVRPRLRRGRHRLHRPAARGDRSDGVEDQGAGDHGRGRGADRARRDRAGAGPRRGAQAGRGGRLPGRLQGRRRRRRQGLPCGDDRRRPRGGLRGGRPAKARSSSPTTASTSSATSRTRATSRSRSWPTRTAT